MITILTYGLFALAFMIWTHAAFTFGKARGLQEAVSMIRATLLSGLDRGYKIGRRPAVPGKLTDVDEKRASVRQGDQG